MGVYIPNMEMPTVCVTDDGWYGNCPMDRVWCAMRFKPEYEAGQRIIDEIAGKLPAWCPLHPLPEKHGRLIDADDFSAVMKERQLASAKWLREAKDAETINRADAIFAVLCEVKLTIGKLPTIVEAEGERDG